MRMGLREANQNFSSLVRAVKAGHEVVLTDRGKPIAIIKPAQSKDKEEAIVQELCAGGFLRAAKGAKPMSSFTPRRLRGRPISESLREERDED